MTYIITQFRKVIVSLLLVLTLAPYALPGYGFFNPQLANAAPGVPEIISYQGRLTDSTGDLLGGSGTNYYFKFSIWDDETVGGGTKLWPAGAPGTTTLNVEQGVFNVNIGDTANGYPDALTYDFQTNDTTFLQVEVSANIGGPFETLAPRQQITSAGYAINAGAVQGYEPGTGADNILTLDGGGDINITGDIITAGYLQANTLTPTGALTVGATSVTALLQGSITNITSTGVGNDIILNSADTIELQDNTNVTGNLDVTGVINAGSSNVNITLATGMLDADALGLITAGGAGSTSSGSGLEVVGDALGLLQGCANNEILKWNDAGSVWACAADSVGGGAGTLQDAYNNGNAITTTDSKDFDVVLADTATDSNFDIDLIADNTVSISRNDGASTESPSQLLLLENLDTNLTIAAGINMNVAAGGAITTGVDLSDAEIVTAFAIGNNDVTVGGATISAAEFAILDNNIDLTAEVTGLLPTANGGTGINTSGATNGQLLIGNGSGLTLAALTQGTGVTITNGAGSISIATTLGTTVDLTSEVTGTLPVGNGGTGATSFTTGGILIGGATISDTGVLTNGQLLIGDGSGAPTISTLTQGTGITITNGAGSITVASTLGTSVDSSEIDDNTITATDLAATLTFADGDLLNLSAINTSSTTEGLILPQATSCAAGTAEGQICWDSDSDILTLGTGSSTLAILASGSSIFTAAATSGTPQIIAAGDTLTLAAGTGITTTAGATDTITIAATLGTSVDLTTEVTGTLPVGNGGTGATSFTTGGVVIGGATLTDTGVLTNGQLLIGDGSGAPTVATLTQGTGITVTNGAGSITITNSDLGSSQNIFKNYAVSGQNTIAADSNTDTFTFANGTGITITTNDTTDTLTITSTLGTDIDTTEIVNDTITATDLAATLTFADGDLLNLSAINTSSTTEGLILPQATSCAAGTAEGQICWDTDNDFLSVGNGATATQILTNSTTLFTLAGTSGSSQLITSGDTVTIAAGAGITTTGGATDTVTIAATLGTSVDLTTEVTGVLPVSNGGTGANTLTAGGILYGNGTSAVGTTAVLTNGQLLIGDGSGEPTLATLTQGSGITITNGAGSITVASTLGTSVDSSEIDDNTVTTTDLAATLTFADGDLLNLSAINTSSTTEGLILPQATSCTSGTAEGQICWDTDNDFLSVGNGTTATQILTNSTTLFTLAGTSGSSQLITSGDTVTIAAGTGITTTGGATDTVTIAATLGTSVDLTTEVTGILPVANGGTGANTLTSGGILYGNGTSAVAATAVLTNGQLLIGDGSGAPTLATLTQGSGITITNGAGSIEIAAVDTSATNELQNIFETIAVASQTSVVADSTTDTLTLAAGTGISITTNAGTDTITITNSVVDTDTGDEVTVNGSATTGANFLDTAATGSVAGTAFALNTATNPDDITLTISNASDTVAGVVTTGTQTFAGDKRFNGATSFYNSISNIWLNGEYSSTIASSTTSQPINQLLITQADDADATDTLIGLDIQLTNSSGDAGDTLTGLQILNTNNTPNQVTDAFIYLNNLETSAAVTSGLIFGNSGVVTTAIDASASNIGTALNVGANSLVGTTGIIDYTNFDVDASGNLTAASATLTGLAGGGTQCLQVNNSGVISATGTGCGSSSGMSSFTLAGTSGTPQTITDGNTVTIAAGTGITTTAGATDTVTIAATLGTDIDLTSEVTGILPVANGGTGANTLTSGGILYGNGTSAVAATSVLTNGQLLIGDGSGAPTLATLTQGSGITITNGAGSIEIAAVDTSATNELQNLFETIAVASQTSVVADSTTDTLTLAAGTGISITTDAGTDTITITNSVTDTGDEVTVNGSATTGANFLNSAASGSSAGTTWTLNTASNPDDITLTISNASATEAGVVTTGSQTFAGSKTFDGSVITNSTVGHLLGDGEALVVTATTNSTSAPIDFSLTLSDDADATDDTQGMRLVLVNDSGDAGDVLNGLEIFNSNTTANQITDSLVWLLNEETASAVTNGILIQSNAGGMTYAIDASDSDIVTALNVGANDIVGTTGLINFTNFDVDASGNVSAAAITGTSFVRGTDTITDFTGTGLQLNAGALETTLGTSVDLTTEVTGILPVANGGTGANTLTSGGILYGNGTSAIAATAVLTNGQLLIGDGSGAPTLATLTQGSGITITNGAGSIEIAAVDTSATNELQNIFETIAVATQSNVVADSTTDTLTLVAGSGTTITTNATTDEITLATTLGTSVDLTTEVTGILPLANGGTNKNFTASNGSIVYSDADSFEASAVGTSGQALISGGAGAPTWFAPTAGSVLFAGASGALAEDNNDFTWNNAGNTLTLGNSNGAVLSITGPDASSSYAASIYSETSSNTAGTNRAWDIEMYDTGDISTGTDNTYGILSYVERNGTQTGGVVNVYGSNTYVLGAGITSGSIYGTYSEVQASTGAGTTAYVYYGNLIQSAEDNYGFYFTGSAGASEYLTGLYLDVSGGLGTNYAATFLGGNVGIGTVDAESLLEVQATEGNNAVITLDADDGDDAADTWQIRSVASDNSLAFFNDSTNAVSFSSTGAITSNALTGGGTQCLQTNNAGVISGTGSGCGSSTGISTLTLAGSSGTPQSLVDTDTITIAAGTGITTTAGATDTVTIAATLGTSVDLTTEVTGILPLANGGTNKNFTASNGSIVYSDADSFEASAVGTSGQALISGGAGAPTWFAPTAGSVLFAGTSGILAQDNTNFFWDDSNNRLGINDNTPSDSFNLINSTGVIEVTLGSNNQFRRASTVCPGCGPEISFMRTRGTLSSPADVNDGDTMGDFIFRARVGGSESFWAQFGATKEAAGGQLNFQTGTTAGATSPRMVITAAGNVGIGDTTPNELLTVGTGELFQVTAFGLVVNTVTLTQTSGLNDVNLTLGNDADVDTISAINIDVTSAATGDADIVYGLNIGNLTSADATVLERALRIGSGWDEAIDVNGTLISLAELQALDGGIDLTTEVTGILPVANGGTGANTLTSGGILYGNGTSAIAATAVLTNGQLLIGDGSGAPTLATLTQGSGITITNGAGSIEIAAVDTSATNELQNIFETIAVATQSNVVADSTTDTLTLAAGTGISITTNAGTDTITITNSVTDTGDEVTVNGSATTGANFLNSAASGSSAGTTWSLNTATNPDDITLTISNASATEAGVVTTGTQTFAGAKTLTADLTINKADSSIVFDTTTATDTDFWLGVVDDGAGDDDDLFQIGDGVTPGSNAHLTINTAGNVGIGTTSMDGRLNVSALAQTSTRESILSLKVSDGGNSVLGLNNGTGSDSLFYPSIGAYQDSSNTRESLGLKGFVSAANDASDSASIGIVDFSVARTDSSSNPFNGTYSDVVNRKLFTFRNNSATYMTISGAGNIGILDDTPASALTVGSGELFQVTSAGLVINTVTLTDTSSINDFNLTLGNDADADTISAINIDVTSAATGDADVVYGLNIGNLTSADGTVLERALRIGSGWDEAIDVNGTLISLAELQALDGGISLTAEVSGILPLANGGTNKNFTASNGSIVYSDADSFEASAVGTSGQALISGGAGAPTWFAPTAGSVLFAGTSGILQQDNASFFFDDANNRLGLGDTTPDGVIDITASSTSTTAGTFTGIENTLSDTGVVTTGTDNTYNELISLTRSGATGGTLNNYGSSTTVTGTFASGTGTINNYGQLISVTGNANGTSTNYGIHVTVASADTNYAGVFMGGNVGILDSTPASALTVGSGELFQVTSAGLVVNTVSLTNTSSIYDVNMTLVNDTDVDTISAINVDVTSAATGDADVVYGLNLNNVTSADATVNERALRFGTGWDQLIDINGTLISSAELSILDSNIDLTTEVTGILPVANGGTGANTLTAGGILFGNGTSAVGATAVLTNGQLLIGDGTGEPTLATLTQGSGITITNGAGSITIAATDTSATNELQNLFETIAVATQSNVVADSTTDTLTLVAGSGTTITTNATTDEITLATTLGTSVDLTTEVTGILPLANGGTNKNFTASNGSIVYSDADSFEASAVGTSGQALISGGAGAPTWFAPSAGSVLFAGTSGILAQDNTNFFWNDTTNRLGIGDATPDGTLDVSTIDTTATAFDNANFYLELSPSGDASAVIKSAAEFEVFVTSATANSLGNVNGANIEIYTDSSSTNNIGNLVGVNSEVYADGSSSITNIRGGELSANNDGSTVGSLYGAYIYSAHYSGTTTNNYGAYIHTEGVSTNRYGLYIGGSSCGGCTLNYGLYQERTDASNYFGSNVGIGDTTPASALTVGSGELFQVTSAGLVINTVTLTATSSINDVNLTLGNDADVDTISAINIDVTSAATGDADIVYGLNIGNLSSADGTVLERALRIGSGWDEAIDVNGTLISSTELAYLDGGIAYNELTTGGAPTDEYCLTYEATGTTMDWQSCGGGGMSIGGSITSATEGSVLFAGASGVLAQDNANFFWDDTNNRLGLGDATPDAVLDVVASLTNTAGTGVELSPTFTTTSAGSYDYNGIDVNVLHAGSANNTNIVSGVDIILENSNTATTGQLRGMDVYVTNTGAGTVNNAYGLIIDIDGNVTTGYGIFLENIGGTTDYGIYQSTFGDDNYFAGQVGIGDNTPSTMLDVTGLTIDNSFSTGQVASANFTNSLTTTDTTSETYNAVSINSTINTPGADNKIYNLLKIATTNTDVTGVTTNLISANYGSNETFRVRGNGYMSLTSPSGFNADFYVGDFNGSYFGSGGGSTNAYFEAAHNSGGSYVGASSAATEASLTIATYGTNNDYLEIGEDASTTGAIRLDNNYFIKARNAANSADLNIIGANSSNQIVMGPWTFPAADSSGCFQSNGSGTVSISSCLTTSTTLFTLAGTSGTPQTITSGDTVTIAAGTGITTTAGATDTVTIAATLGTSVDLTTEVTGILPLANGGTNKNFTASNGSIVYSDADSFEASAVGTSGQALISGGAGAPTWFAPTAGSVLFAGTSGILAQDNTNFFWDDSNNYLGIGDNTPDGLLDLTYSSASTTAGSFTANVIDITDTGITTTGTDSNYGTYVTLNRSGATGGSNINTVYGAYVFGGVNNAAATVVNTGMDLYVDGDTTGTSTNIGIDVHVTGADTNYAAIFTGGNVGILDSTPSSALTVGSGELFQVTSAGLVINTVSLTNTSSINDVNLTLGNDADADTISAINIDVTSAATGDADIVYGLNIGNLSSADGTVLERALRIGSGWDEAIDVNGTLISSTELAYLDGGVAYNELTTGGAPTDEYCLTYEATGTTMDWQSCSAGAMAIGGSITSATEGSVLFAGPSGVLAQDNANFFWDDTNNRLGLGDATPDAVLDVVGSESSTTSANTQGAIIEYTDTGVTTTGSDTVSGLEVFLTRSGNTTATTNAYAGYFSGTFLNAVDFGTALYAYTNSGSDAAYVTGLFTENDNLGTVDYYAAVSNLIRADYNPQTVAGVENDFAVSAANPTMYGLRNYTSSVGSGIGITGGGDATFYGVHNQFDTTHYNHAGNTFTGYGLYNDFGGDTGTANETIYGVRSIGTTYSGASDVFYGEYITSSVNSTGGTQYGIYVDHTAGTATKYGAIFMGSNVGIGDTTPASALTVGSGELFQVTSAGLVINTVTLTDTSSINDVNLTLGNDADVDTISAINIDVTSAATGDADIVYGINIGNLSSANATVLERALRIGSGWDEAIDVNGTLISLTELAALDGGIAYNELVTTGSTTDEYCLTYESTGTTMEWQTCGGGGMSIGGTVTSGTTGSILFVGASSALSQDNTNFFWDDTNNRLGLGANSSLKTALHVVGTVTTSGADAIATIFTDSTLNNSTASGFQFGARMLNTVSSTVAGSHVGQFIRVTDSTSLSSGQVVRGLEVQAYSGTNNNGVNTGIATYGKTFGIQAETTAQAGAVSQPAAVFADLNNSADGSLGNAIRAYTDNATSATLVSLYQETSSMTGVGLNMNLGNGAGSFSGNFIEMQKAGTSKFTVDDTGRTDIAVVDADNAIALYINTEESTVSQSVISIESDTTGNGQSADTVKAHFEADGSLFVSLTGTQTTNALCHASTGMANNDEIVDCSGAPTDLAEYFGSTDASITAAELVVADGESEDLVIDGFVTSKAWIKRSSQPYQSTLLGVISTSPSEVYGDEVFEASENPRPVALAGRVPVKVNLENGPIKTGDYLTSSSVPGVAMKSTKPGMVVGQALSSYNGNQADNSVVVFVSPFYYDPTTLVSADGSVTMQRGESTTTLIAESSTTAFLINQKGSGDLLQIQTDGVNRFSVQNTGVININAVTVDEQEEIFVVESTDGKAFAINSRGDVEVAGVIIVKDDTFAGSIATDENGEAEIEFTYHLGTGKPVVQLTPESESPVFAQVVEWTQDTDDNYTGFKLKTFGLNGAITSAVVHYNVVAKQLGYETDGEVIEVVNAPTPPPSGNTSGGSSTGGDESPDAPTVEGEEGSSEAGGEVVAGGPEGATDGGEIPAGNATEGTVAGEETSAPEGSASGSEAPAPTGSSNESESSSGSEPVADAGSGI